MALELELSEAWVRAQPALRGLQPEQVDSLSLQGTYAGKIVSLGDGLKSFKNLQSLDLSKNLLVSLEGLESLQSLERLNLYYNHISSLLEVSRLQTLPRLKELDLRLNPVTRKESDYRLFTVCRLQALEKLDDRTVRENERKAAHLHLSPKNKESLSHKEKSREHMLKNQMLDQETVAMSSLDAESIRTLTESSLTQFSHHHVPYHDGKDSLRVSSASVLQASKSAKELKPHSFQTQVEDAKGRHFLCHNPLNREHKPLSSAPQAQTSLRPQVRSRAGSAKGRFRVSFSEGPSLDLSHGEKETGWKLDMLDLGRDVSPTRRLNSDDAGRTNPQGVARESRLVSSTAHRELLKRLADERKAANSVFNYSPKLAKEAMAATRSSCGDFLGQYVEMDSDHESSLKPSSDAKLNSHLLPLTDPTIASFGDFQSKCRPLSDEILLEDSQPVSAPISVSRKGQEPPISRSLSPLRMELKRSKSPTHCFKEANMEASALFHTMAKYKGKISSTEQSNEGKTTGNRHQCSEQKSGHIWAESPLGAEKHSPVIVVLQQLLELVDRYWNGTGSLLHNKDFLAPARDLLVYLMAAAPSQQDGSSAATPSSNSARINYRIHKDQLKYSSQHFPGITKTMQKPEESQVPSFNELDGETSAALNYNCQGKQSFSYDELLSRNEQLSAQLDVLTLELKQLQEQQDTISVLRESQKSLVSTNNFLLQQLNREQGPSSAKGALHSEKTAASAKVPLFERLSHRAPPSGAFGSSQICSSLQLSSCPL